MRIGYARVSTVDQHLDLQLNALHAAGCDIIFEDQGVSGASTNRPGLSKALRRLRTGDTLVVWRLDRLGRSLAHLIKTVSSLRSRGVQLRSLTEAIDTGTPTGNLVFHIFGAISEFERCLISERSVAGVAAARAKGRHLGRRPALTPNQVEAVHRVHQRGHLPGRAYSLPRRNTNWCQRRKQLHACLRTERRSRISENIELSAVGHYPEAVHAVPGC
ncbi:recombinase family protein [Agrobacterium tumefaciens]|uniref:Recombinase family protein n=1 Tax=Agrobacterium tumefaciens TaxID=358 RepID=A0A4D7Z1E9_AGRTU|nr:recombinase family protein [Agrobacterium tumefaciens]